MPTLDCPSVISRVTVYARGAVVTRRVELPPLSPEPCTLRLAEITSMALPGSIRTHAEGERAIVGLTTRLVQHEGAQAAEPGSLTELRAELIRIQAELERATTRRDHLAELALSSTVLSKKSDTDVAGRIGDALAISALVFELTRKLDDDIAALSAREESSQQAIEAAELAAAQSGDAPQGPQREIEIGLGPGPAHLRALEISYAVPGARWWPAYSARIFDHGKRAEFGLEAFVAQNSLEDWVGVALTLCTADMVQDIRLPELPSLRLGRAQPPKKRGYRPPPEGLDALFAGYDAAMGGAPRGEPETVEAAKVVSKREVEKPGKKKGRAAETADGAELDDGAEYQRQAMPESTVMAMAENRMPADDISRLAPKAEYAPPPPAPIMAPQAKSAGPLRGMAAVAGVALGAASVLKDAFGGGAPGGMGEDRIAPEPQAPEVSEDWLDFDALWLPGATDRRRGKLTVARGPRVDFGALADLEAAHAHAAARDVRDTRGLFDHQFSAEGKAEIPSNGRAHRVYLLSREAQTAMRFTCVACEDDRVFREAELQNPLNAPLLPGPVDVFVEGALLTTSEISATDRGGKVRVGLGVEERLRVVRNVRANEESKGLLGGSTAVHHGVSVEVTSSLPAEANVEVIERVPVSDDKEITVAIDKAEPRPEPYDQKARGQPVKGGRLFKLAVKPGAKAALNLEYTITLPAGSELLGGNRRE